MGVGYTVVGYFKAALTNVFELKNGSIKSVMYKGSSPLRSVLVSFGSRFFGFMVHNCELVSIA